MLKLSQKKRKALLALAVAAAVLGANNAFAASVHDKAITESNQYGSAARTYWKEAGVYNAKTRTYTFDEDVTLKPKASEQEFNNWTPMFGGIYIAGNKPITIDMQGHRLDIALNVDQPNGVANVYNVNPNAIHASSADSVITTLRVWSFLLPAAFCPEASCAVFTLQAPTRRALTETARDLPA